MSRWIEIHDKKGILEVQFIEWEQTQYTTPEIKFKCNITSVNNIYDKVYCWIRYGEITPGNTTL